MSRILYRSVCDEIKPIHTYVYIYLNTKPFLFIKFRSIELDVDIGNSDQLDDFWSKGYKVMNNDHHEEVGNDSFLSPCPLFDQAFVERVMYIGKAVWIISKFGIKV